MAICSRSPLGGHKQMAIYSRSTKNSKACQYTYLVWTDETKKIWICNGYALFDILYIFLHFHS